MVSRRGYYPDKSDDKQFCEVSIRGSRTIVPDSLGVKLGSVKLKDSGFSNNCDESDAMKILQDEACALGADLIVILEDTQPDGLTTCYRCSAVFYRFHDLNTRSLYPTERYYSTSEVGQRVEIARKETRNRFIASVIIAVMAGLVVILIN